MGFKIALYMVMIYIFIGMAIFMGVILVCEFNRDDVSESDIWLLDKIKMTTQQKPFAMLFTIIVFGIIWLPVLITSHGKD